MDEVGSDEDDVVLEPGLKVPGDRHQTVLDQVVDDDGTQPVVTVPHRSLLDLDDQHGCVGKQPVSTTQHAT